MSVNPVELLRNPPPNVDLTVVGGQALAFWTLIYSAKYPELFPSEIIASTYDLDFIVRMKESCQRCHDHWGGRLSTPNIDDATPELGVLHFNEGTSGAFSVDFLPYLLGIKREEVLKDREQIDPSQPGMKDLYVLTERLVLYNRICNTLNHPRYQRPNALNQVRNAIAVYYASIVHLLESGNPKRAARRANAVLKLAARTKGLDLFFRFDLDLVQAVPLDDNRFEAVFLNVAQPKLLEHVARKRSRRQKHIEQRLQDKLRRSQRLTYPTILTKI